MDNELAKSDQGSFYRREKVIALSLIFLDFAVIFLHLYQPGQHFSKYA